ncbi:hypothetical protein SAY87_020447 [Trapa incisa]|uniref:Cyanobacterial aminoacyl-tRNA synthetase CAAD domain-containing protein n=1 Tax=Trapa incisa TaxID=236973 RepID=A0AAN7JPW0_9MYRT|nr:hypothetical protein SAY87_020447 [Trapa incisa]
MTASTTPSSSLSLSSSTTLLDGKPPHHFRSPNQCVSLPALPALPFSQAHQQHCSTWKPSAYCRKIARNIKAFATGEATPDVTVAELPEIFKTMKNAWDNVEDKYAVTSLGVAGFVALVGSNGMILAIERLPLIPGILEVVGIGYTGWFAYKNLIFKPDREALLRKLKDTYRDIIGTS